MKESAEDCARGILRIFSAQDVRAGAGINVVGRECTIPESHSAENFAPALAYAIDRGAEQRKLLDEIDPVRIR